MLRRPSRFVRWSGTVLIIFAVGMAIIYPSARPNWKEVLALAGIGLIAGVILGLDYRRSTSHNQRIREMRAMSPWLARRLPPPDPSEEKDPQPPPVDIHF